MPSRRRRPARAPAKKPAPRAPLPRAEPPLPRIELRARPVLAEAPHAHIVCRVCGRIAPLPLDTESALRLEGIADGHPEGWSVELVAFSVTGACPRCREGPVAPG